MPNGPLEKRAQAGMQQDADYNGSTCRAEGGGQASQAGGQRNEDVEWNVHGSHSLLYPVVCRERGGSA